MTDLHLTCSGSNGYSSNKELLLDGILTKRACFKSVHVHFPVFCIVFWRSKIHWG